jgi:hypothetical protein
MALSSSPSPSPVEDLAFNRNLDRATEGLNDYVRKHLLEKISPENASIIVDYILAMHSEVRVADTYRLNTIVTLKSLAEVVKKPFKDMGRQDIINFLNKYRKSEEKDPTHKWIGTYNQILARVARFFKWYYNRDIPPNKRLEPPVIQNIGRMKRLEDQTYDNNEVWTLEDDILFLTYCPSKRDKCFHMMARDAACRPDELLKLKIKDVVLTQDAEQKWYAEIPVNGKTGSRTVPLFHGVPYYKAWIEDHPVKNNPDAPLFCASQNKKNFGRRLSKGAMYTIYVVTYQKQYFAKLAAPVEEGGDPTVPKEDKKKLRVLLKKPWNPYLVHRHSTLTEVSERGGLGDSELFDQLAGWKPGSPMRRKYVHLKPNSGARALLKLHGVKFETEVEEQQAAKNRHALKPLSCPSCNEVNEAAAKFCRKCGMILKFDHYKATTREAEETKKMLREMQAGLDHRMKEDGENYLITKNLALEVARLAEEMEADRKRIEELDKREAMLVAILEERRREAEQQS